MSFADDVLPAISALAEEFASIEHDIYFAGIWAKDLHRGLLWNYRNITRRQSQKTLLPSWSWASWVFEGNQKKPYWFVLNNELASDEDDPFRLQLKSAALEVHSEESTAYGRLREASLHIRAWMAPITFSALGDSSLTGHDIPTKDLWRSLDDAPILARPHGIDDWSSNQRTIRKRNFVDFDLEVHFSLDTDDLRDAFRAPEPDFFVIVVARLVKAPHAKQNWPRHQEGSIMGLIVKRTGDQNSVYVRAGLANIFKSDFSVVPWSLEDITLI